MPSHPKRTHLLLRRAKAILSLLLAASGCMIDAHAGLITPLAGTGSKGYAGDGAAATAATLSSPSSVAVNAKGEFFISDFDNNVVRKVDAQGVITTVVGNGKSGYGGDGGPATLAALSGPVGLALDPAGNLYVSELNNHVVRLVATNGQISTVAGNRVAGYSGNGGKATSAALNSPAGIALDFSGNLFIADQGNSVIRRVDGKTGVISTIAGTGSNGSGGDGGPATLASLNFPWGVAVDQSGNVYVADTNNYVVRKVDTQGVITTVAGSGVRDLARYYGEGVPATSVQLFQPRGVAIDSSGNLLIADTNNYAVRWVDGNGIIRGLAGFGVAGNSGDGGFSSQAKFNFPIAVAKSANGDAIIVDSGFNRVRRVAGATAQYSAAVTGALNAQSVAVTLVPPAEIAAQAGAEFIAALLPNNQLYLMGATGWVPFDASRPAAYAPNLQALTVPVANGNDLTGIKGTTLYAGYGRGATAAQSFLDMLTNLTLLKVGTVQ